MTTGCHLLKGIRLSTFNNLQIPFENELMITVNNEEMEKQ